MTLRDAFPQLFQPQRTTPMQPNPTPAVAGWNVSRVVETGDNGGEHETIIARRGDQVHRFSPNTTNDELVKRLAEIEAAG